MPRTLAVVAAVLCAAGCNRSSGQERRLGQTSFTSAPPGQGTGRSAGDAAGGGAVPGPAAAPGSSARAVEETDIYRLEGDRLYTLNGYRGLLVFDIADIDHPRLLGRSPIYGWPVEMVVHGGIATVVVSDWYGLKTDGTPFHGSVVRGLDATDPLHIKTLGEAQLAGWVRDTRVVGSVLYAVSQDYGWTWGNTISTGAGGAVGVSGGGGGTSTATVVVSSVNFAGGVVQKMGERSYPGWSGVINVTPDAILLAHDAGAPGSADARTQLTYIDISDPAGSIAERGSLLVPGHVQGWGPDEGRWNLDFADGKTAHVFGCGAAWCGSNGSPYVLSTGDFTNPRAPVLVSSLEIPVTGYLPAVRFDGARMYLSPGGQWTAGTSTPLQIYDLADKAHPRLAGETRVPGLVWSFFPQGASVMALGAEIGRNDGRVSVSAIDATDAAHPVVAGTAAFGEGWAWTPAAGTFKAFTRNDAEGLIVLPFSGWSPKTWTYRNGLQLIETGSASIHTAGAAITKGWVERGVFAKGRLLSLSDLSLAVVEYSNHQSPAVVSELTLARNTTSALPLGDRIAEVSGDFWDNDLSTSTVRVLPIGEADELHSATALAEAQLEGVNPRVFHNGDLAYVVTDVQQTVTCPAGGGWTQPDGTCRQWVQQVQVLDLSGGSARLRGKAVLPGYGGWYWGWYRGGFEGCFPWDWFNGADTIQVEGDALALRRWIGSFGKTPGDRPQQGLFVVDLKNPDAPAVSQLTLTDDDSAWWGNLVLVGKSLYATHEEWILRDSRTPTVRYWANRIDLSNRAHPRVASRVNVPGVVIGGPASDSSLLYVTGYRWTGDRVTNSFDVLRLDGDTAQLIGTVDIDGWIGRIYVRGDTALVSSEQWGNSSSTLTLHQLDLANPQKPRDLALSRPGWGWLVGVEGDRALVTSGFGGAGLDVYRLAAGQPPVLDRFVRTRGYWPSALARQGDDLFISSGYWGVETVHLGATPY